MEFETLNNAPITEAVYDIKLLFEERPNIETLEKIHSEVKDELPLKEQISVFEASFGVSKRGPRAGFFEEKEGFMFKSSDKKKIMQAKVNSFTFNKLNPYDNWVSFKGDAQRYWNVFISQIRPTKVYRLALRYINRIELPAPAGDLSEYLKTRPIISGESEQGLQGFMVRMNIEQKDRNCKALVTLARDSSSKGSEHSIIILDIETFQDVDLSPDSSEIITIFEQLRQYKNELFFNNITEKTKALFS